MTRLGWRMRRGQRYNGLHVLPLSLMKGIKGFAAIPPSTVTSLNSLCNRCLRASLPEALDLQVCPISESPAGRLQYVPDLATVDPGTFSAVYQASLDAARCSDVPLSMILSYRRPRGYLFFLSNLVTELGPKSKTAWLAAWILA